MTSLRYAAWTQASPRHRNQDAILIDGRVHQQPWQGWGHLDASSPVLAAVADGVSTSPSPAVASRAVLTALLSSFSRAPKRPSTHYAREIHEHLCSIATRAQRGMASTLAAVIVRGDRAVAFHAGDSRIYLLYQGQIKHLSSDHTMLQGMIDRGEISAAQAAQSANCYRSLERCFVADSFEEPPGVAAREFNWRPGMTLLLCSDGLTGEVDDATIASTLQGNLSERADALVRLAVERGSEDDISVILLECDV